MNCITRDKLYLMFTYRRRAFHNQYCPQIDAELWHQMRDGLYNPLNVQLKTQLARPVSWRFDSQTK